ncbi:MAG: hypothetical protein RR690_06055 [Longicatena sp.]
MVYKPSIDSLRQNLLDADCSEKTIAQFMQLEESGQMKEQLRLLSCHRCKLLQEVHERNKKLDCLDYLMYQLKKQQK